MLGSIAASQYSSRMHDARRPDCPPRPVARRRSSIAGALHVADELSGAAGARCRSPARTAFVDGIHVAVIAGAILATIAAFVTYRYLPRELVPEGAGHAAAEPVDDTPYAERVELGLGGLTPAFVDEIAQ